MENFQQFAEFCKQLAQLPVNLQTIQDDLNYCWDALCQSMQNLITRIGEFCESTMTGLESFTQFISPANSPEEQSRGFFGRILHTIAQFFNNIFFKELTPERRAEAARRNSQDNPAAAAMASPLAQNQEQNLNSRRPIRFSQNNAQARRNGNRHART